MGAENGDQRQRRKGCLTLCRAAFSGRGARFNAARGACGYLGKAALVFIGSDAQG